MIQCISSRSAIMIGGRILLAASPLMTLAIGVDQYCQRHVAGSSMGQGVVTPMMDLSNII